MIIETLKKKRKTQQGSFRATLPGTNDADKADIEGSTGAENRDDIDPRHNKRPFMF